ncbi:MAG: hypothetical protein RL701_3902 [Pseudomonadota bacterium]|jgi:hypothetical protein
MVTLQLPAATAYADEQPWVGLVDTGLGFASKFNKSNKPGACKSTGSKVAGALTHVSPNAVGALVGFALGAVAGGAATRSFAGAVRAGFVAGSIGSAMGLVVSKTPAGEKLKALAERYKDLLEKRDNEVCGVVELGERLRKPVLHKLGRELAQECDVSAELVVELDVETGRQLQRCIRLNPEAQRIVQEHVPLFRTINHSTCEAAAYIVEDYNHLIAESVSVHGKAFAPRQLTTDCDDVRSESPSRAWAPKPRGEIIL